MLHVNPADSRLQTDAVLRWASGFRMQLQLDFGHLWLVFGMDSCVDALRKLASISLETPGEDPICARVKWPVMVAAARDSMYKLEPHLIYRKLAEYKGSGGGLRFQDLLLDG
ncbi:uncharacterized protein J7T54_008184 [Emericellopsis cladophorae]|uniref:Uncharacterized protein n=1 Tax=Emericellopsis cladophorae TaxID=2686198 RepID=A0A9Q0BHT1_9HYPO|nr:uncharacterized protein J7T54_008184 [Emericellopsis cladophorae]KAI6785090.1 hypothetical protein J7T54_008184 [Emericellopsis cladophorae]